MEHYPSWYWKNGLHDAKILSVNESGIPIDWKGYKKGENLVLNCLAITLDASGAYESDITEILIYGYKINHADFDLAEKSGNLWWLGDTLSRQQDSKFNLKIYFVDIKNNEYTLDVSFVRAEVKRR